MFAFAVDHELIDVSPAIRVPRPGREQARDRVLSEDELRARWTAWAGLDAPMAGFYKLRLLTAQRGAEVPRFGSRHRHRAAREARSARRRRRTPGTLERRTYVLAGARGAAIQSEPAAGFGVDNFRGHDLRRTAASLMTSGGVPRLIVGKTLNHAERGVTAVATPTMLRNARRSTGGRRI
jgi:integrase